MKQQIEIPVEPRTSGKALLAKARKEGKIPGVVYNPKLGALSFFLNERAIFKYTGHAFENSIFVLKSADKKLNDLKVLFKEKTVHPLSRELRHVDFYAIDATKPVRVNVEVRFTGKPIGTTEGGMFQAIRRDIEIEVLPDSIPEFLEVNTDNLGVHDSLHVSDLNLPTGVKAITDGSVTLCTVVIIAEEVAAPVVAAAAPTAAEPELVGQKGKKEEEGAAAPPAKGAAAPAKAAEKK